MGEWLYKATDALASFEKTEELAKEDGFLCRKAYKSSGERSSHAANVEVGDVIHFYFSGGRVIGSFEVIGASSHPSPARFGPAVEGTALHSVVDSALISKLKDPTGDGSGDGYGPDPQLNVFTGWLIRPSSDATTPPFNDDAFGGQNVLVKHA